MPYAVTQVVTGLLGRLPLMLVWVAGIVFAVMYWKKHPRASLYTTIACSVELIQSVVWVPLSVMLPQMVSQGRLPASQMGLVFGIVGAADGVISVGAWVLVLLAIFGRRDGVGGERV